MRTISLRRVKKDPEHFVLFEGNFVRHGLLVPQSIQLYMRMGVYDG